jgi:hypothetical protein
MTPDQASALVAARFKRHVIGAGTAREHDVYRRSAHGRWFLEARHERGGYVDVGLTLDREGGGLIGPIHRALSATALASALPDITASLEAIAQAAESIRCPTCHSWAVMHDGADGPFLGCSQPPRTRRPFDGKVTRCRRNLVLSPLILYGEPPVP